MKRLFLLLLLMPFAICTKAQQTPNEARQIFEKAYNQVFGPQGCTLKYDVNLIGLFKTSGTIWYKEKKSKFTDARVDSWNDGVTVYTVYRKKKVIEIHDATSDKRDKYAAKFKFTLDDFNYSMERNQGAILIKLKQRRGARGTVKQAQVLLNADTYAPISARIKVMLFWANIKISNFKSGGISDDLFVFPRSNYGSDYRFEDKR